MNRPGEKGKLDQHTFGPWALITGASSGIGQEFARQIGASGIHVVLVARREAMLIEVGQRIAKDFGVQYRVIALDLSDDTFLSRLDEGTRDLDIGLVVSNGGAGQPGEFLKLDRRLLQENLRLNTMAHLNIAHYFGSKLAERGRGGFLLVGAMGAEIGVPLLANDGAAKSYVHSLGQALHEEFKPLGVRVTVVPPPPTDTPALVRFGFDPKKMPMKPMSAEQCVSEGLKALVENRAVIIPGRMNRIMNAFVPASVKRTMTAKMFGKALRAKLAVEDAQVRA